MQQTHEPTKYITSREARKRWGVCADTLRRWADDGTIRHVRTPGGKRLFAADSFEGTTNREGETDDQKEKASICYCRVSSAAQKDDLQRQVQYMRERFPDHRIITDVGSGINFKRRGLRSILELAGKGGIQQVVVADRDRLCRFAFDLVEWILQTNGVQLVVLNQKVDAQESTTDDSELADDLLSIIQVFNCRVNGRRKYHKRTTTTKAAAGGAHEEVQAETEQ